MLILSLDATVVIIRSITGLSGVYANFLSPFADTPMRSKSFFVVLSLKAKMFKFSLQMNQLVVFLLGL